MDAMGLNLHVYMYDFRDDFTEPEIARGFEMARALGVKVLNTTSTLSVVKRIDAYAKVEKIRVGLHNHTWFRPNEVTTPANYEEAMSGCSEYIGVNLDVGHLFASGFDPVPFIERHHARITTLHLKDRKKNDGPDMPFGQGDTPLREILRLMKRKRYRFPAMIEYENQGPDTFEQVAHALAFCANALKQRA
jgi:sugar phosphate isomerase/epimerase